MTGEGRDEVVRYWVRKAREALAAARDDLEGGRLSFAVNRCYYAAFYAASAVLLQRGFRFVKHTGVRGSVHRELVKPGLLTADWGAFYDSLFDRRMLADYVEFSDFQVEEVEETIEKAGELVAAFERLLMP